MRLVRNGRPNVDLHSLDTRSAGQRFFPRRPVANLCQRCLHSVRSIASQSFLPKPLSWAVSTLSPVFCSRRTMGTVKLDSALTAKI
jgi:hypothetical protein